MDIIKKLFCFNDDEESAIGLCKFNDNFFKAQNNKRAFEKRISKDTSLSVILKRPI